jgi:ribosomal protein S18 acetylase RimI-like enzyme
VRIRDATVEDAGAIARLQLESWRDAYRGLLPDDYLDSLDENDRTAQWQATIAEADERVSVLAAEEDDQIVGFVHTGPSETTDEGQMFAMHVRPPLRGHGIGFDLHDLALRRLRQGGFHEVELWLLKMNRRARQFYERQGWEDEGTERPGYPPTGALETRYVRLL